MRYHFFLHYGWFFQNLGKEAIRTFMHTTVYIYIFSFHNNTRATIINFRLARPCATKVLLLLMPRFFCRIYCSLAGLTAEGSKLVGCHYRDIFSNFKNLSAFANAVINMIAPCKLSMLIHFSNNDKYIQPCTTSIKG